MSFFNFGPSPTKSSGQGQQSSNSDFNMFGAESSGQLFGGQESDRSIFGGNGEFVGSKLGSAGFAAPMKQEQDSGQVGDIAPSLKKQRLGVSNPRTNQSSGVHMSGNQNTTAHPPKHHSRQEEFIKKAVDVNVHGRGAPSSSEPSMTPGYPHLHRENPDQTKRSDVFHEPSTTPDKVQAKPNSDQKQVVMEEEKPKILTSGKEDGDLMPADQIFKDLLNKQWQQLSELLPELKASEEMSEQVLDNAMLVLKEVDDYGEKLAGIKQQYCSRLSQVSSFLKMIPKHEK